MASQFNSLSLGTLVASFLLFQKPLGIFSFHRLGHQARQIPPFFWHPLSGATKKFPFLGLPFKATFFGFLFGAQGGFLKLLGNLGPKTFLPHWTTLGQVRVAYKGAWLGAPTSFGGVHPYALLWGPLHPLAFWDTHGLPGVFFKSPRVPFPPFGAQYPPSYRLPHVGVRLLVVAQRILPP